MNASSRKKKQIPSCPDRKPERAKERGAAVGKKPGRGVWLLMPVLLLAVFAAYQPAWHGGMLWDDDAHITPAPLRSADGLRRIWFDLGATQQYYPVLHSAFWLLFQLWGDHTPGYHLLNIALHALSAFLFALLLRRLAVPGAFLAAFLFALHPVHVESVAWITELKNTLSTPLYLAAALAYLRFDKNRQKRFYALALALFLLALLSKTVTATLPAALLVLFWWQRRPLRRRDLLPLAPFFALGIAAGLLTAWVERSLIGAQGAEFQFSMIERALIAGRVIWFYLAKLFWPTNLIFIYPRWLVSQSVWWQYLYPLGVTALLAGLWLLRKHTRAPLAALLLFCGSLFPVLGFFNVFPFRFSFVADHFQYLPSLPVIALFAAAAASLAQRRRIRPASAAAAALALLGPLAFLTWSQSRQYAGAETLYQTTLSRNPSCWMAHVNLGMLKLDYRVEEAVIHFNEALRLKPDLAEARHDLGNALQRLGRFEEALVQYHEALRLRPGFAEAHNNLGNLLQKLGRLEEAVREGSEALRIHPDYPEAHYNLGTALAGLGRLGEAVTHFKEALRIGPERAEIRNDLGFALHRMGRLEEAGAEYRQAVRLNPRYAEAQYNMGVALLGMGRLEEAAAYFRAALRINPLLAAAHNNLGYVLMRTGRLEEAAACFQEALKINPDYADARANLDRVLPMVRTGKGPDQ